MIKSSQTSRKKGIFKPIILLIAATVLIFTGIANTVYAAWDPAPVIVNNVSDQVEKAARVHLLTQKMNRCLDSINKQITMGGILASDAMDGKIFQGSTNITVGRWLESVVESGEAGGVGGFIHDGEIWCPQNNGAILKIFAEELGIDYHDVLCNGSDPGVVKAFSAKNESWGESETCGDNARSTRYVVNAVDNSVKLEDIDITPARNYLKSLYENWVTTSGNPYAVSWNDLNNYDKVDGYYAYYGDMQVTCGGFVDDGVYDVSVVDLTTGQIVQKTVTPDDEVESYSSFVSDANGNASKMTCWNLVEKVNEYAPLFRTAIIERLGDSCYERAVTEGLPQAQEVVNNQSNYDDETIKEAQEFIDLYNTMIASTDAHHTNFVDGVDDTSIPLDCKNIGNLTIRQREEEEEDPADLVYETVVDDASKCSRSGSKLGWILCPIITGLQEFMDDLYENIVEPMLQINVSVFDTDNGVYQTWQTFQNIANVIFVIIFLFAIFSQITGFGIDNYGIKRLLPKLIIAAILINLSFIICQALVDISNIVGNGAKDLLMSARVNGSPVSGPESALTTFVSGAAMTGIGVGVAATAGIWAPALLIPFLLGLLSALIGLIFMFILLGIRQAGVIVLVIVSPLAILMYMLPNTKSIFDKWKNLFQALLVLYPVCGLMIGGCALAGKVIISSADNFWMALLGGLLSVIPFFLVPKLTKGAMSAMGKIGGMLTGAGQKIRGATLGAAKFGLERSPVANVAKNAQDREQLRQRERERKRLTGVVNHINRTPENVRTDKQKRQLAMAQSQLNRMTKEDATTAAGVKAVEYDAALAAAQSKRFDEDVAAIKSQNVIKGISNKVGEAKNFDINNFATGADAVEAMGENSLTRALYEAAQSGDEAAQYAATSQLLAAGHHGAEGLRQVMSALGKDGNKAAISTIAKAAKNDRNLGELKSGARSSYDFINKVAEGKADGVSEGQRVEDFVAKTQFGKMSEAALYNTDDEELTRMAKYIKNNRADIEQYGDEALGKVAEYERRVAAGETDFDKDDIPTEQDRQFAEAARLISQANKAWKNERLRGNAKKSRQDLVYEIAHGTSAPQDSILDIEH